MAQAWPSGDVASRAVERPAIRAGCYWLGVLLGADMSGISWIGPCSTFNPAADGLLSRLPARETVTPVPRSPPTMASPRCWIAHAGHRSFSMVTAMRISSRFGIWRARWWRAVTPRSPRTLTSRLEYCCGRSTIRRNASTLIGIQPQSRNHQPGLICRTASNSFTLRNFEPPCSVTDPDRLPSYPPMVTGSQGIGSSVTACMVV
jgi:hypothetical protein